MDYEPDNINHRDKLLSAFRESLSRPLSDRYFDEEELLEVFDYAGDVGDDYLRMEALMCASRYFPDSEQFQQRKAIFYNQYSDDTASKYIADNASASGMLWDIMRARHSMPADEQKRAEVLDDIAANYNEFCDEEVIQFIDLVSYYEMIDWLKSNLPMLRKKVMFVNILLYEIAVAAEAHQDVELSVKMLEELTELEPFNFYFWMMLARVYESLDQGEKALNAIDYALAISPEDPASLITKAKLLYVNKKDADEVIEVLKRVLDVKPDMTEAVKLLANIYSEQGNKILASVVLNDFIKKHPESVSDIVPDLVLYRPKNLDALLDKFYASNEENAQFIWASWAHQLSQNGFSDISEKVLDAYQRNSGYKIYALYAIEDLFKQQRYEEAILAMSDYLSNTESHEADFPSIAAMHLLSMIKVGEYDHAEEFCNFLSNNTIITRYSDIGSRLEFIGLSKLVRNIKTKLKKSKDPADWIDFDPLELWQ